MIIDTHGKPSLIAIIAHLNERSCDIEQHIGRQLAVGHNVIAERNLQRRIEINPVEKSRRYTYTCREMRAKEITHSQVGRLNIHTRKSHTRYCWRNRQIHLYLLILNILSINATDQSQEHDNCQENFFHIKNN